MTRPFLHGEFPPAPLRQYALIADGERGALCGPHGELVWLCLPQWQDDAVFATLVGGRGGYAITPARRSVWGGYYEPGTLIWRNRWVADDNSAVECRDALALPADVETALVLRRVIAARGQARVRVFLDLRDGYGAEPMADVHRNDDGVWTARSGRIYARWTGCSIAAPDDDGRLVADLELEAGQHHDLLLELSTAPLRTAPPSVAEAWRRTEQAWHDSVPDFAQSAAPRDARHAYAVMRGLTSHTGGMVAAATTSLPEQAGNSTNYDYRYVWVRDQCYAGLAAAADGPHPLLDDAVRFVTARLLADGDRLRPSYLVTGQAVPPEQQLGLAGYPGGGDILGNRARDQFQLDAVGESLLLFAAAARHDAFDGDAQTAARLAVQTIEKRWDERDAGIWEVDDEWWTHSRLVCVAGLRQLAAQSPRVAAARLTELADRLLAETARRCHHPDGRWQRSASDGRVDASLLLPPVRGAVAADDSRTVATLDAIRRDLVDDGYVYRFASRHQPLGEREGAFLLCGFMLALAELHQGNLVEAFRWFERNRAACGPPGLLAEEFDVRQRQLRGNLPQAFVHALLLETAVALGRVTAV